MQSIGLLPTSPASLNRVLPTRRVFQKNLSYVLRTCLKNIEVYVMPNLNVARGFDPQRDGAKSSKRPSKITSAAEAVRSAEDLKSSASPMFNVLVALESASGLLNVREVASLLGKSPFSIYRLAQKRQIPSMMIGGHRCFDPSVLALWLAKKEPTLSVAARRLRSA
jgi:excisionase family DNA binding protein